MDVLEPHLEYFGLRDKTTIKYLEDEPTPSWFLDNVTDIILYDGLERLREWSMANTLIMGLKEIDFYTSPIINPNDFLIDSKKTNMKELLDLIKDSFETIVSIEYLETKTFCI